MSRESVLFIIPVYNEAENILSFIRNWIPVVKSISGSEILFINDGSTDRTGKILAKHKKYDYFKVLNKKNEGHGKTIRLGYEVAIKTKHAWVFQTDSDGQFSASDYYALWDKRKKAEFIQGYRNNKNNPLIRYFISLSLKYCIHILYNLGVKDANIPFRLIKRNYLTKLLKQFPDNVFAPNIFLSILASKERNLFQNIPLESSEKSNSTSHQLKMLKGATRSFFELIRFRLSIKYNGL